MALVKDSTVLKKQFYRHTFDIKREGIGSVMTHTLVINPDTLSMDEPARNTVTQTLGGAYVTDFGRGLPQVVLAGTTGYKARISTEGEVLDGYEAFQKFRNRIYRNFIDSNDPELSIYWYNWEDDEFYEIQPQMFRLQRSKQEALLYRYEFRFTCLRKLLNGNPKTIADFLSQNPSARDVAVTVQTAASAVGEFISKVFGG